MQNFKTYITMKDINLKMRILPICILILLVSACSDDFLNRPPEDSVALDNFYSSEEELMANSNVLYIYNFSCFCYHFTKAF